MKVNIRQSLIEKFTDVLHIVEVDATDRERQYHLEQQSLPKFLLHAYAYKVGEAILARIAGNYDWLWQFQRRVDFLARYIHMYVASTIWTFHAEPSNSKI